MKLVVLGAAGVLGSHVIRQALGAGHEVTAYVRDARKLSASESRPRVVEGTLSDEARLREALAGADAVVSCLGVSRSTPRVQPSRDLPAVLAAMKSEGVRRYIGVSGAGVTLPGDRKGLPHKAISVLMKVFAPHLLEDKELEYAALAATHLDWTLVRSPRIVERPGTGNVKVNPVRPQGASVAYADVAAFMLGELSRNAYLRAAPFIAG